VHHAVNDRYVDKNYGGILIVWDRLFGSFEEQDDHEPCVYGTRAPLRSWNPVWANVQVYRDLVVDSWRTRCWADKLRVWLKPPGWRPADVAARWPTPAFDIAAVQRFDPPLPPRRAALACALFAAVLAALGLFLWFAQRLTLAEQLLGGTAIVAALWAIGALSTPRAAPPRDSSDQVGPNITAAIDSTVTRTTAVENGRNRPLAR
jgi:hypothetical protein